MQVDAVFSGGGIKGLAFIGAYEELEAKGITFSRLAGTSAGSIIASLIAAGYTAQEVNNALNELDLTSILDKRPALFPLKILNWLPLYWRLGLYKGQALENWIAERLLAKGIKTFADLPPGKLRVIVSDLTNGKMVVLPDDLHKYDLAFESFSVAKAVRMSCSIPYFFEPVQLKTSKGKVVIVDGGVLSNFPMWLFEHDGGKQKRPVIGLKLSHNYKDKPMKKIKNALQLFEALFATMMDAHDARYISKKHVKNIIFIPTEGIVTTEFSITEEKKSALIEFGKLRTQDFLKRWTY
ncbi:patatin-like phospholipase family protein [Caldibacillus lycopersici]|uniref:Patatin-like phospholipase family protein n=1 Tax=Perspicuibacillus lycopersici TaxID=1325689 RepID=A0AAE3IUI9_9BACI|nr:patatin-like phospholipase family protein [Perspicuibacillus lycopersici]MCU9613848.1 patatin-like phospholipase family protein [Perspicuibacillus lycopersici]